MICLRNAVGNSAGRRETLLNMAQAARRVAIIDAAERVADECKRLATG